MGDTLKKWEETRTDEVELKTTKTRKLPKYDAVVSLFENEYPELSKEFKDIQKE